MKRSFDCRFVFTHDEEAYHAMDMEQLVLDLKARGIEYISSDNSDIPVLLMKDIKE